MLTYRGDKFIKGKKFTINESVFRFQKRDSKDRLVFEGIDGKNIKLTEDEFNNSVKTADNITDDEALAIVKSYYEDGDNANKVLASDIITKYALDDNFPKLQEYLKDKTRKNAEKVGEDTFRSVGDLDSHIDSVANEYRVYFDRKTPFDSFAAADEDDINGDDYAAFYDDILHDLGYGENPVLNDMRAETHYVSDGNCEMSLFYNGNEYDIDLKAWDTKEDVKNNVKYILGILNKDLADKMED